MITSFCLMLFTTSMPSVTWPKTVCTVEVRLRRVADEELAAARVLARVRHRQRAGHVLVRVEVRLALDLVARAAGADARLSGSLDSGSPPWIMKLGITRWKLVPS